MPFFYFPMQNFEKIAPRTSGSTLWPVILPNAATAVRNYLENGEKKEEN